MSSCTTKWHAPNKDSDQPEYPPSLIRDFTVCMKKPWDLAIQWVHSKDSDQTGRTPRLIWVFAGRIGHFIGFVVQRLKSYLLDYCRETDQVGIWWWFRDYQHMSQLMRLWYFSSSVNSILQMHMRSHSVGLDVWFLIYCHTSCVRIAKALARLCGCTG